MIEESNDSSSRDHRVRSLLPKGVRLFGKDIDNLHRHQLHRCLTSIFPQFRAPPYRWKRLSSGGWRFQHEYAEELLDYDFSNEYSSLFGGNGEFEFKKYEPASVAYCYAPKRIHNNLFVECSPGLFKAETIKKKNRKKANKRSLVLRRCYFNTQEGRAIAIREGATVSGFGIDFRMPFRRACLRCLSFEHQTEECLMEIKCRKCGDIGHVQKDCESEGYRCIHCHGDHASSKCWEAKRHCQEEDLAAALGSVRSYREVMNNEGEDTPLELPYNQVKMCRERHWDIEKFASRTGSDLVRSGRKKQKKSYAAALGRKSRNQRTKP